MAEDTDAATAATGETSKSRDTRPLPPSVARLTAEDPGLSVFGEGVDTSSAGEEGLVRVAKSLKAKESKDGEEVGVQHVLNDSTLDRLRQIAAKTGAQRCASASKSNCRRLLAKRQSTARRLDESHRADSAEEVKRRVNSQSRLASAVPRKGAIGLVSQVNDNKKRSGHEAKRTPKQTWMDVADIHNDATPDDDLDTVILPPDGAGIPSSPGHKESSEGDAIDPSDLAPVESDGKYVSKIISKMSRIRSFIKSLLDDSGRDCPNPFAHIATAMKRADVREAHKSPACHSCVKCEQDKEDLEARFSPSMDEQSKGPSEKLGEIAVTSRKKKKADDNESVASLAKGVLTSMRQGREEEKKNASAAHAFGVKEAMAVLDSGHATPTTAANCQRLVSFAASEAVARQESDARRRRLSPGDGIEVGSIATATSTLRGPTSVAATSSSLEKTITAEDLMLESDGDDEDEDDDDVSSDGVVLWTHTPFVSSVAATNSTGNVDGTHMTPAIISHLTSVG